MKSGECSPSGILGEGWKIMYPNINSW
jgi:hypothetical protein